MTETVTRRTASLELNADETEILTLLLDGPAEMKGITSPTNDQRQVRYFTVRRLADRHLILLKPKVYEGPRGPIVGYDPYCEISNLGRQVLRSDQRKAQGPLAPYDGSALLALRDSQTVELDGMRVSHRGGTLDIGDLFVSQRAHETPQVRTVKRIQRHAQYVWLFPDDGGEPYVPSQTVKVSITDD